MEERKGDKIMVVNKLAKELKRNYDSQKTGVTTRKQSKNTAEIPKILKFIFFHENASDTTFMTHLNKADDSIFVSDNDSDRNFCKKYILFAQLYFCRTIDERTSNEIIDKTEYDSLDPIRILGPYYYNEFCTMVVKNYKIHQHMVNNSKQLTNETAAANKCITFKLVREVSEKMKRFDEVKEKYKQCQAVLLTQLFEDVEKSIADLKLTTTNTNGDYSCIGAPMKALDGLFDELFKGLPNYSIIDHVDGVTFRVETPDKVVDELKPLTVGKIGKIADSEDKSVCVETDGEPVILGNYQKVVKHLVQPNGPCKRLVVAHRLGSGKSYVIMEILENFMKDPRPKLLMFSAKNLRNEFLEMAIEKYPKSPFVKLFDADATLDTNGKIDEWYKSYIVNLEKKPKLYNYKFETTGGSDKDIDFDRTISSTLDEEKLGGPIFIVCQDEYEQSYHLFETNNESINNCSQSGFFRWGKKDNVFTVPTMLDNMVILIDEMHLVIQSDAIRNQLTDTKNSTIVGFTGTIPNTVQSWNKFSDVFSDSKTQEKDIVLARKRMKGRLHYFNGPKKGNKTDSKFFEPSQIVFEEVTQPEDKKEVRKKFMEQANVFKESPKKLGVHYLSSWKDTVTLKYLNKVMQDHKEIGKNTWPPQPTYTDYLELLNCVAPLVAKVLEEIDAHLKSTNPNGILVFGSNKTGRTLLEDMLKLKETYFLSISGKNDYPVVHDYMDNTSTEYGLVPYTQSITGWNNDVVDKKQVIIIIDTAVIQEGTNIYRVQKILSMDHFQSFTKMKQTFGRADRRCAPQALSKKTEKKTIIEMIHFYMGTDEQQDQDSTSNKVYLMNLQLIEDQKDLQDEETYMGELSIK
jgi:hypothetical protein